MPEATGTAGSDERHLHAHDDWSAAINDQLARDRLDNAIDACPDHSRPVDYLNGVVAIFDACVDVLRGTSHDPLRRRRPDIAALVDAVERSKPLYRELSAAVDRLAAARNRR